MTELDVTGRFGINFAGNENFVEDDSLFFFKTNLISQENVEIFSKFFEEMNVLRLFNLSNREIGFEEVDCTHEEQVIADKIIAEAIRNLINPKDLFERIDKWYMIKIFSKLSEDKDYLTEVFASIRTIAKSSSKLKEITEDKIKSAAELFIASAKDLYERKNF